MTRALALTRDLAALPLEMARTTIVVSCAIALIAAGQALPF